jgi:serine/threonine-protein kinase BUR1
MLTWEFRLKPEALSLLKDLLKLDWRRRITAVDALQHPYFATPPLPARPEDIPKYNDSHELDRRNNRPAKQLPPAPEGGDVGGMGANGDWGGEPGGPRPSWQGGRMPHGGHHDRDHHRGAHNREYHGSGRVLVGAGNHGSRRSDWQGDSGRHNGDQNGRSSLPPPPGDGARHPLPSNPIRSHGMKDTYIPSYAESGRQNERPTERRGGDRREDRRDDRRDRDRDDRRDDYYRRDRDRERRPRDDYDYRDRDRPTDDRYRERERDRDHGRTRSRSPEHRDRGREAYRERDR